MRKQNNPQFLPDLKDGVSLRGVMNHDLNVQLPEIAATIANVAEHLRNNSLGNNQSLFLENFPVEHLPVLNSVILTGFNVGVYTKADPVFGGAGVRIFSIAAIESEKIERKVGDWAKYDLDDL